MEIVIGVLLGLVAVAGLVVGWKLNSAYNRRILRGARRAKADEPRVAWSSWATEHGLSLSDHRSDPKLKKVERRVTGQVGERVLELEVVCSALDVRRYVVRGSIACSGEKDGASLGEVRQKLTGMGFRCVEAQRRLTFDAVNGWLRYDEVSEDMAEGYALEAWWSAVQPGASSG